jgi:hypothetical protein
MNVRFIFPARRYGSVLVVTLCTSSIMGIGLASYLTLVNYQNTMDSRSQSWNEALCTAEAGIEEAMAQLTYVPLTTNIDRGANGWVYDSGSYRIPAPRLMQHGTYNVRFSDVQLPVITSTGTITNTALGAVLVRAVEVHTVSSPVFSTGMAAISNITMNGNFIRSDSYVSTDPAYSTNGKYDPAKFRTNGSLASVYGVINVGNGNVYGNLLTGPTGSDSMGPNGMVAGTIAHDFNAEFEDVHDPANLASFLQPTSDMLNQKKPTLVGSNVVSKSYDYAFEKNLASGDYYRVDTKITGSMYVGTNANVTLYITASVQLNGGNDLIYLAPGAKLTIYMAGSDFTVASVVNNGSALDFTYRGLPSNTSVTFNGNAAFTGTIYAPEAALTMNGGGGQTPVDFSGACVVKSVIMNGHLNFHYDEAVAALGPSIYKAGSWREL